MTTGNLFTLSVDLLLICRGIAALSWGIILAILIQYWTYGKFVAEERTWFSVIIGVGVDLLIAWRSSWEVTCIVIALSSVGIIFRSLANESKRTGEQSHPYIARRYMSDATKQISLSLKETHDVLDNSPTIEALLAHIGKCMSRMIAAREALRLADLNVPIDKDK